ncbi:MAG: TonB-dependent receptor [Tannerellaceae bacterium]|jgi:iron complex outermembrane receptor protein|nr:TonB-dependent receptor [Tannerellaceae bacterium]
MRQKHFYQQPSFRFKKFVRKGYAVFNSMHKVVNIGVVAGCVLTAMPVSTGHAQNAATDDSRQRLRELELEEVMVTASRLETPIGQAARLLTVIGKEQIEQAPGRSIQDILVYAAGIDLVQRGGHGVQADLSIRGGTFDQNTILLNGVNLSNAHTGHYSLDIPVNLSDIERIEIIHGPSALVYGAGSFSGGINIVTRKKAGEKLYAHTEAGMHRLRGMEVRSSFRTATAGHSLSAGHNSSGGYIANSDYDIYNVLWQTQLRPTHASGIDIQAGYNDKRYGANTFYSARYPEQYEETSAWMGSVKGEFGAGLKLVPILYWDRHYDRFDLIRGTETGRNFHRNDTYGGNLILLYPSKLGNTSLGAELRREDILSSNLGNPLPEPQGNYKRSDSRTTTGAALEHTLVRNRWILSAGVLLSHTTLLKKVYKWYPSLNLVYRPTDALKLSASWSQSTRMPTFTDLYYTTETHKANTGLRPEKSESFDLGIRYTSSPVQAYLRGFLLRGRDMIDWVKVNPHDSKWASWNLTKVNTRGLEAGVRFSPAAFAAFLGERSVLSVDYARMHQSSDTQGLISLYALNYLRDKFTAQFSHQLYKGLSAAWFFRFQKRMGTYEKFENLEKTGDAPYPAFSTLDLKLTYPYQHITLSLNLHNLYDTYYFDKGNIPQAGFWLTGSISYTFEGGKN